jgi:protein-L-isoaspartate(D-aspartate) O-methyltransferase
MILKRSWRLRERKLSGILDNEEKFAQQRMHMVEEQIVRRGIRDERVIAAFREVPRHRFVPQRESSRAYEDSPLPIGQNQTISQPYIVAYMLQMLDLRGEEKVLEIGTGSGYQAALLGKLAMEVYTMERHGVLAESANKILAELGYDNVNVIHSDGSEGWPEHAPYDAIIVAAGAPVVPQPLLEQLGHDGRLVIPVGEAGKQILQLWMRSADGFSFDELVPVAFVPLIGKAGWKE